MAAVSLALQQLREQLGNSDLYTEANRQKLAGLLKREGELKVRGAQLDDIWLEQQQTLEDLSA